MVLGADAERAALRAIAHLLPDTWRQIVEVAGAAVPPTPEQRIPAPADAAAKRLEQIEHIVVVMLENRSTIFTRFCQVDGRIPEMTARAGAANHLGYLLRDDGPRADVPDHSAAVRTP